MSNRYPIDDPRLITTSAQLRRAGVSAARIQAQLDAGRWRRWGCAIAAHNGPLTPEQQWCVARAHCGPRALLTAFTALQACGLTGWERAETHVLVPRGARILAGCPFRLIVHRTRTAWCDIPRRPGSLVHRRQDALVRAAGSLLSGRAACGIVAASIQQRLVRPPVVAVALRQASRLRHRALLLNAVADIAQGADALSEIDFVRLCRRAGLPEPMRQSVRTEPSGRRRYLDATWRRRDGRTIVAEVDGAVHLSARRWWDDQLRQNEITLSDALVLRFPSVVVRTEPDLVVSQLRRVLVG